MGQDALYSANTEKQIGQVIIIKQRITFTIYHEIIRKNMKGNNTMATPEDKYDKLKLDHQLCFPLYACAKELVKQYKPFLDPLGLTYTQYLVMMVLWEEREIRVKDLGSRLFLDSGTLTPLLKRMEGKGLVTRRRPEEDERNLIITITDKGFELRDEAVKIPSRMACILPIGQDRARSLYDTLYDLLGIMNGTEQNK